MTDTINFNANRPRRTAALGGGVYVGRSAPDSGGFFH